MSAPITNSDGSLGFGEFCLLRELGRGGMGIVYEARESALSRRVALKTLPPAAAFDSRQLARFRQEAAIGSRLDHPHIVPVYSVGCQDGAHFYVMKYIEGRSLKELLDELRATTVRGDNLDALACRLLSDPEPQSSVPQHATGPSNRKRPEAEVTAVPSCRQFFRHVAELGIQAAEGLAYAHSQGIIHGDIKPANLLVDRMGHLWLTDFGMSRLATDEQNSSSNTSGGTLRYLSPEQARGDGHDVDHRADIYSLGATLFEMVTLKPPGCDASSDDVSTAIAFRTTPRATNWNPAVPSVLESILYKAMASDPAERYQTAADLAVELQRFLANPDQSARPSTAPKRRARELLKLRPVAFTASLVISLSLLAWSGRERLSSIRRPPLEALPSFAAWQWLGSLNESILPALCDHVARGQTLTASEQELLKRGPVFNRQIHLSGQQVSIQVFADGIVQRGPVTWITREEELPLRLELANALYRIGVIHGRTFEWQQQERMIGLARALYSQRETPFDKVVYRWHAALSVLVPAQRQASTGGRREAIDQIKESITVLESLYAEEPENPDFAAGLALLHLRLSEILVPISHSGGIKGSWHGEEVNNHLAQAEALLTPWADDPRPLQRNPFFKWPNTQDALAECLACNHRLNCSDQSEAKLLAILGYLTNEPPSPLPGDLTEWRQSLVADAQRSLGIHFWHGQRYADAESFLQQSLEGYDRLMTDYPAVVEHRFERGRASFELAGILQDAGRPDDASEHRSNAHQLFEKLASDWPDVAEFHHFLAGNLNNMSSSLPGAESTKQLQVAIDHEQTAIRLDPESLAYRRFAVIQLSNLVSRIDTPERVIELCRQALDNLDYLAQHNENDPESNRRRGDVLNSYGLALRAQDQVDEAQHSLQRAADLFRILASQSPRRPDDLSSLGGALSNLAETYLTQADHDRARTLIEEAISLQQEALRAEPNNAQFQKFLEIHNIILERLSHANTDPQPQQ